jgi:tetratricopeptide (TPR) repeat protein
MTQRRFSMPKFYNKIISILALFFLINCGCESDNARKIKLASSGLNRTETTQSNSSVLQIAVQEQKTVAILPFKNETNEVGLDWLKRGLADMLTTDLRQSPYLNVITPNRLSEIAQQLGYEEDYQESTERLNAIARKAQIQTLVAGRYYNENDKLLIGVDLYDIETTRVIPVNEVEGESLEKIFSMVNELSDNVRENLHARIGEHGVDFTRLTNSVEAFKCYSKALENFDKLLLYEAVQCLRDAIKLDSTFAAAYLRLAMHEIDLGDKNNAVVLLNKARFYSNRLSDIDKMKVEIFQKFIDGNFSEGVKMLEEVVITYPTDIESRINLAGLYQHGLGDMDRALEHYQIALELDPTRKTIYNSLGYLYAARGEFNTAFQYFNKYQELAPDEPNPYDSKGEILMQAGQFEEAIDQLKTALDKWPGFYHSAFRLAELYCELGDYKTAVKYLDDVNKYSTEKDLRYNLSFRKAITLWRFNKTNEAEKVFEKLLEEFHTNLNFYLVVADMYKSHGDSTIAQQIYKDAFENIKKRLNMSSDNLAQLRNQFEFFFAAELPRQELIEFFRQLSTSLGNERGDLQILLDYALGLLYLREGKTEIAKEYFQKDLAGKFDLIAQNHEASWDMWKYLMESFDIERNSYKSPNSLTNKLLTYAREHHRKDIEYMMNFHIARMNDLLENEIEVKKQYQELGSALETTWRVIGPFSLGNYSGFQHAYPPEQKIDLNVSYKSAGKELTWQSAEDGYFDGYIDFKKVFRHTAWSVGYGLIYIQSPEERKVQIRLGSNEACKVWLNNKLVWQHFITSKEASLDRDLVTVLLNPGYNKLLVKITNNLLGWGYFLRVTDENGNGFPDITFHSYEEIRNAYASK